jgi:catechol 2,3-dioxygenase-like lactoylglutathione lyase family enzyme
VTAEEGDAVTTQTLPSRLHHNAYLTKDQEATRAFYEDIVGLPLVATWSEADELFGAERVYCHTFFGLGDGSALAFFQFADPADQAQFDPQLTSSPFRHIALKVTPELQRGRTCSSTATAARSTPRIRTGCSSSSRPTWTTPTTSPPTVGPMPTRP